MYSTDNGAEKCTWPDGGDTPFRGRERGGPGKAACACRCAVRWPGVVKPGTVINGIMSHEDWAVTLLAAAGEPDVKEKLLKGHITNGKTFRVHLDAYDQRELLAGTGPTASGPRSYGSTTTATSMRCAFRTGKPTSRLPGKWLTGGAPGAPRASQGSSICVRIPSRRIATVRRVARRLCAGWWDKFSGVRADAGDRRGCSCRPSGNSRSARSRPASTSSR